jgi:purine-binding chemotaxis protein CheW
MSEATLVRLLVFRVGNLICAAEVDAVREILPRLPTTRIPGAPPVVAGLVNVRGTLVTVVEGWRALGQPEPPVSNGAVGSTVLLEVGERRRLAGFTVDEVMDMLAVGPDTLEERAGGGLAGVDPMLVRAVGRRGDQLFVVLDVVALLGPILSTQGREQ